MSTMTESAKLLRQIISQMKIALDAKSLAQAAQVVSALDDIDTAVKFYDEEKPEGK